KEKVLPENIEIREEVYEASGGKEIFISAEDFEREILIGYLRLRFPSEKFFRPEIDSETALVRELHVYGPEVPIGQTANENAFQHRGFGKKLLSRAEEISKENGYKKLLVLSGIGAKEYYKKLGYDYEGAYMRKFL
ncbi:TPA: GNAT family N-acetyltransferase, partial [archaeon]|nr:GNAT family N-acetyltransferase [Candidatus Naiadarchaeales archaeon SRR2090153.bin1042]